MMNRVRPWLSTILALSANSPYWLGLDTGYASYRTELFGRLPMTGVPMDPAQLDGNEMYANPCQASLNSKAACSQLRIRPDQPVGSIYDALSS